MTRVLALVGIVALLLYFRIPQRINWDELRGFKGADRVEDAAKPFLDGLKPEEKPLSGSKKPEDDAPWMRSSCQLNSIRSGARLTKADYNRHRSASDLNADDPLQDDTVKPFCVHQDGAEVFIPAWLVDQRYRLKVTSNGDRVERVGGGQGM